MEQATYFLFNGIPISSCLRATLINKIELPITKNICMKLGQKETLTKFSSKSNEHYSVAIKSNTFFGLNGIMPTTYNDVFLLGRELPENACQEVNLLLGILRLIKPLPIQYTGWISENFSNIPEWSAGLKYYTCVNWDKYKNKSSTNLFYTDEDVKLAKDILSQLENFDCNNRVKKIAYKFFRIDLWKANSRFYYPDDLLRSYFALLDRLCLNPYSGSLVASCIGKWLDYLYPGKNMQLNFEDTIKNVWNSYRAYCAHDLDTTLPPSWKYKKLLEDNQYSYVGKDINDDINITIKGLHEILRLTILALLFLPDCDIQRFNQIPAIENYKPRPKRNPCAKEHDQLIIDFFDSLLEQQIQPKKLFWIADIHENIFSSFCKL